MIQNRLRGVIAAAFSLAAGLARSVGNIGNNSSVKNTHNWATNKLVAQKAYHSRAGSEVNKLGYLNVVMKNFGNYARFQLAGLGHLLQSIMAPAGGNQLALAGGPSDRSGCSSYAVNRLRDVFKIGHSTAHGMVTSTSSGGTMMKPVAASTMPYSKHTDTSV